MFIRNHELNHQHSKCKRSRRSKRSRCDKCCSDDNVKRNVHLKKISRFREHVSIISMSVNAATYHDNDDVDTAMSLMLTHKLACITIMLQ